MLTIKQAIDRADEAQPNVISQSRKVKWLSELDSHIFNEVISTHHNAAVETFGGYTDDTDATTTELLIGEPYDSLYEYWLRAHYDYDSEELNGYNNNMAQFNEREQEFRAYYNRTHMPKQTAREVYF